ncbi:kinase-like protein [Amniculicola lignicola CBS 123094]|uniref:Kinase-like protein n=1 Tax=Amniculicola lignicola CBS 123094 TaxID=1392246 RepID=A0A6A5W5D4_9PLEO|nr:kinase-like protein [Amniculicola lignicola CBS 123094]
MSVASESTFFKPRYLSDSSLRSQHLCTKTPKDLLNFLSVVQRLGVSILPTTWQEARGPIGAGATGKINEALMTLHTSLAFKCVSDRQKEDEATTSIISAFIAELRMLCNESIRRHPNVAELQGVCWDIICDASGCNKVYPVLVFEKSQYGDLGHFVKLPLGRDLSFPDRLSLCRDIVTAVRDIHSNYIIHGDLKPENILVFVNHSQAFIARITDFGYSSWFTDSASSSPLPVSRPWNAPEHDKDKYTFEEAKRMDIFSCALVCLWVLFEPYFAGVTAFPEHMSQQHAAFSTMAGRKSLIILLETLKYDDCLTAVAERLLMAQQEVNAEESCRLLKFFASALPRDPAQRTDNVLNELARNHDKG